MPAKLQDPRFLISVLVIVAALLYDMTITFWKPLADPNLVGAILGALNTGGFAVAIQFWLGSSSGSKEKDDQIRALTEKP